MKAENINYWLEKRPLPSFLRIDCTAMRARAVFSGQYNGSIDDDKLFPQVFNTITNLEEQPLDKIAISRWWRDEDLTVLDLAFTEMAVHHDNYLYIPTIKIINSEVGKSSVWIKPELLVTYKSIALADADATMIPTDQASKTNSYFGFLDSSNEGATCIRHRGNLHSGTISFGIKKALKAAQVGVHKLLSASTEKVEPIEETKQIIKASTHIPNRILSILEDEYKDKKEATRLEVARSILKAISTMPIFAQHLAAGEVGRHLDLFRDTESRMKQIVEDIKDSEW